MKIIKPSIVIESNVNPEEIMQHIEKAGRTCYKSEERIDTKSSNKFIKMILDRGHETVIEHIAITVRIICDRGVSHEIVRHRLASYSQESTRYCNYSNNKFGGEITVIEPCFWNDKVDESKREIWLETIKQIEKSYLKLIELGASPQEARSILPNSLKTEIVMTANLREWRHFLKLRTAQASHPQMREVANMILEELVDILPVIFSDIKG